MKEEKFFPPDAEIVGQNEIIKKGERKAEPFLKQVEADRDGSCEECGKGYKKGDKIELLLTKQDSEKGIKSPSPLCGMDCTDKVLKRESAADYDKDQ